MSNTERAIHDGPDCPYMMVKLAVAMLLEDEHANVQLADVERLLQRAFDLDPTHLDTLDNLANFYHAIVPDEEKAKAFAKQYVRRTARAHVYMRDILGDEYDRTMKAGMDDVFP